MKRRMFIAGMIILFLAYGFLSLSAFSGDAIVVEYADNMRTGSLSGSPTLFDLLDNVAPRIALQYSDRLRHTDLVTPPAALSALLSAVAERISMQYADRARHADLAVVPEALNIRLDEVADRIAFQYADRNRRVLLEYPVELIGDTTPPVIVETPVANMVGTTAVISWTTNEFTTYLLRYGTSSGNYSNQVSSPVFNTDHQATLTGLDSSETYYYQIVSADLSGNQATSQEYVLEGQHGLYLPMITR